MNKHRPRHIYMDEHYYFITAGTLHKIEYLNDDFKKHLMEVLMLDVLNDYGCKLDAWVVLDNHYHMLMKTSLGRAVPKMIAHIHGRSAIELNRIDKETGRRVWYQYWDYCIRNEQDYWKHFNYIHQNPIKHGVVNRIEELDKYRFSSSKTYIEKEGIDWFYECFRQFPIIDFTKDEDNY